MDFILSSEEGFKVNGVDLPNAIASKYTLPDNGIPMSDLSSDVRSAFDAAGFHGYDAYDAIIDNGVLTVNPFTIATVEPAYTIGFSSGNTVTIAAGENNSPMIYKYRDFALVINCTSLTNDDLPAMEWGSGSQVFEPRSSSTDDMLCEAGTWNVFWITEYAVNCFTVARWSTPTPSDSAQPHTSIFLPKLPFREVNAEVFATGGGLMAEPYEATLYTVTDETWRSDVYVVYGVNSGVGTGKVRDGMIVVDCRNYYFAPTLHWPSNFYPRTSADTDFFCDGNRVNVYWVTEIVPDVFVVAAYAPTGESMPA